MYTHIRMDNNGQQCEIIIDTVPYNKAPKALKRRIKKYGPSSAKREVEYAEYTEYRNKSQGWIRRDSILNAANIVTNNVICDIEV